ncbi:MAG: zinc dependent phospholipase C family protein, partial [Dehalococcoidia bacterium]
MPPITLHMVLARRVAEDLSDDGLRGEMGAYLLGATTPDIRVLTREDRFATHFFRLDTHKHQDSVRTFLKAHPELADPGRLNKETQAWAAGYIGHLAMDEHYITRIYRPFFAAHDALGGVRRANVMDRLLQFDLDRIHGSDPTLKRALAAALGGTIEGIECGFIDRETLDRWRQVSLDMSQRNMDWDRMRSMIANHLRYAGLE